MSQSCELLIIFRREPQSRTIVRCSFLVISAFGSLHCALDAVLEKLNAYITQKQLALDVYNYIVGLLTRSLGLLNYTEGT